MQIILNFFYHYYYSFKYTGSLLWKMTVLSVSGRAGLGPLVPKWELEANPHFILKSRKPSADWYRCAAK